MKSGGAIEGSPRVILEDTLKNPGRSPGIIPKGITKELNLRISEGIRDSQRILRKSMKVYLEKCLKQSKTTREERKKSGRESRKES